MCVCVCGRACTHAWMRKEDRVREWRWETESSLFFLFPNRNGSLGVFCHCHMCVCLSLSHVRMRVSSAWQYAGLVPKDTATQALVQNGDSGLTLKPSEIVVKWKNTRVWGVTCPDVGRECFVCCSRTMYFYFIIYYFHYFFYLFQKWLQNYLFYVDIFEVLQMLTNVLFTLETFN